MSTFVVIYEMIGNSVFYAGREEKLVQRIMGYTYARITKNAYLIITSNNVEPAAVRDYLTQGLISGDKVYVGKADPPAAWIGMSNEVTNWIKANLV